MSFSYDPTLADDVSKVRFQIQDTIEAGHYLEDEEISFLLVDNGNVYGAAADAAEALYARFSQASTVAEVDDIRLEYRERAEAYYNLAKKLRAKATTKNNTVAPIFIGGANRKQFIADSEGTPNKQLDDIDIFFDRPRSSGF